RAGIRRGGESGPAVVPHEVDESLLLSALRHESFEMPPDRKLADSIIADFEKWIAMGAPDPREGEVRASPKVVDIEAGRKFWCFQPIARPHVPAASDDRWPATDVDRFILDRLESKGFAPVADADRRTLLRRVYFDLIGLPPTPEQINAFLQNDSPDAFDQVVDKLLRSPQFGERWGRHWLDVVRFAESSGGGRTLLFPDAWRYRDYVIEAFNNDLPYDQFVKQQIAGDLMVTPDLHEKRRQITATAFLLLGPTNYEMQDKETLEMDIVDEQLDTLGKAFLGMTLGCARCHDHKFDPIPTHDYYALAGILKSTQSVIHSNVSQWNEVPLPMSARDEAIFKQAAEQIVALDADLKSLKAELSKIGGRPGDGAKSIDPASLPGIVVDDTQAAKRGSWTLSHQIKMLERKIVELQSSSPHRDVAMAVTDLEKVGNIPVSIRGLVRNPGEIVPRGFLQVASGDETPRIDHDQSGRMQLAEWIADSQNPLTARVIVNRVWYWLYGRGLVRTVDNFGATGDTPSHPELLDYLATKFVEDGWSVKKLVRHLLISRTYRMSSQSNAQAIAVDPDNRLLWRMNRRRLDAESIRDSLLMIGGNLDLTIGGSNIKEGTKSEYGYEFNSPRRSVYMPVFRNELPPIFATFDFADPNTQIGSRTSSTTAPQALLLMNHPLVMIQSEAAAERLLSRKELTSLQRIDRAYEQVLGRLPNEREADLAARFVGDSVQPARWGLLYQTLFQSLDFRYVQ
ncbi:MAG: PSD1 domain-containing protein, partial [Planctomycetia bacterium]|nr:PSD1 domain-containing protein [Planctomycetia bacterium]